MNFDIRTLALAASVLVGACGGGGGGSGSVSAAAAPQVAITETNAKPVAANALEASQNLSATQGASLATGVEAQADAAATQGTVVDIAHIAQAFTAMAPVGSAALATGVTVNTNRACDLGGSLTIGGSVSSATALSAGDSLSFTANSCKMNINGVPATLNGAMSMTFSSVNVSSLPYHLVVNVTMSDLSVQSATSTVLIAGDVRLDLTVSSTSESIVASGSSLASHITASGATHVTTFKSYTQTVSVNGLVVTSSLAGTVVTDSSRLGATGGTYTISTPTAVVFNSTTKIATAGVVKVVGAANSQLVLTVASDNTVTIQIDANGDGVFEKTLTSTTTELNGLL